VLDFYCSDLKLGVEVDGGQHLELEIAVQDAERTARLNLLGIHVLRFTNVEVLREIDGVLERILEAVSQHPSP